MKDIELLKTRQHIQNIMAIYYKIVVLSGFA